MVFSNLVVRRDSLKGRRGRLSAKARCPIDSDGSGDGSGGHKSNVSSSAPQGYLLSGDKGLRPSLGGVGGPGGGYCSNGGVNAAPNCSGTSSVTLLSMLTKAYETIDCSLEAAHIFKHPPGSNYLNKDRDQLVSD